jgi:membrane protease YdiL (CAAX protease family)
MAKMNDSAPAEVQMTVANSESFEGNPTPSVWVALAAIAIYFATQILIGVVLIAVVILASGRPVTDPAALMDLSRSGLLNGAVVLSSALLSLPIIYLSTVKFGRRPFKELVRWRLPLHVPTWMGVLIALVAGILLDAVTLALRKPLVAPTMRSLYQGSLPEVLVLILAVVGIAPLMEEILFRGLLYTSVAARLGVPAGIGITALSFGAIHVCTYGTDWYSVLQTLILGLMLTGLRAWTRSLWPCTVAHVANNLYSTVETLILLNLR